MLVQSGLGLTLLRVGFFAVAQDDRSRRAKRKDNRKDLPRRWSMLVGAGRGMIFSMQSAPVAQWIECRPPEPETRVRPSPGVPQSKFLLFSSACIRGVAQRQGAWFGTRRSAVQICPPRPFTPFQRSFFRLLAFAAYFLRPRLSCAKMAWV